MPRTPSIDWNKAFAYFVGLGPTRTYAKVGQKYGVSDNAVRRMADKQDWQVKARAIDDEALDAAKPKMVRDRTERILTTIQIADAVRGKFAQRLRKQTALVTADGVPIHEHVRDRDGNPQYNADGSAVLRAILTDDYVPTASDLVQLARLEALLEGEPTERIEGVVAEARSLPEHELDAELERMAQAREKAISESREVTDYLREVEDQA